MALSLHLSDFPHNNHARAVLTWPSLGAPHLIDYLEVEAHQSGKGNWWLGVWLDFRFADFLSWGIQRVYTTSDDMAREAADAWNEGVRLVNAYHRGEPLRPPGVLMREAWRAGDGRDLTAALDAVMARRGADGDRHRFCMSWGGHEPAARAYDVAITEWQRSQDWRDYRDGLHRDVKPENRGQMALLEVA